MEILFSLPARPIEVAGETIAPKELSASYLCHPRSTEKRGFSGRRPRRLFPLPFGLSFCIIRVCLDLAGLFRNKDIRLVLMIRLSRMGARKQPHYRIVVIEKARARNGRPVEVVGTYNPRTNPASVEMKRDRVDYWVSKGAQMSERVNKLYREGSSRGTRLPPPRYRPRLLKFDLVSTVRIYD